MKEIKHKKNKITLKNCSEWRVFYLTLRLPIEKEKEEKEWKTKLMWEKSSVKVIAFKSWI